MRISAMNNENNLTDQERQYKLLDLLQFEASRLPLEIQQRFPFDLLTTLSSCLLDEAIYAIINDLEEIQNLTEKSLFTKKQQLANYHRELKQNLKEKHKEELLVCKSHNLVLLKTRQEREFQELEKRLLKEIKDFEMNLLKELDTSVTNQQTMLQQASVPGFFCTNDAQDIKLQMELLKIIKACATQCAWLQGCL